MQLPKVQIKAFPLDGSLDRVSPSTQGYPGSARIAVNYEAVHGGGFKSVGGIERFDGRARPSDGQYRLIAGSFPSLAFGDSIVGVTSGATGVVVKVAASYVAITAFTGTFVNGETVNRGGSPVGTVTSATPSVTVDEDNELYSLVATYYRSFIQAVPGSGPIRGLEIIGSDVYAWRNNAGGTAMVIHKSTTSGWTAVTLPYEVSFTTGSVSPTEGGTITQGAVSATVRRVVVESGTWAGGNAAGRFIVSAPTGGSFVAGALTAGGTATLNAGLSGGLVQAQVTLSPSGRVQAEQGNFSASVATRRLYGCDGVNREFEFDGTTYVPLNTGMTQRANGVAVHKGRLFYIFNGSLQYSGIMDPYKWTPVFGAQELGTGDYGTGFVVVGGSEANAALMVFCRNSTFVLYGSSNSDFKLTPMSDVRGAMQYSTQDLLVPFGYDTQGFVAYNPTQAFGNYATELASRVIDPLVKELTPVCSVSIKSAVRYRCFFSNGVVLSCSPSNNGYRWTQIEYGKNIVVATSGEINNRSRTFYGGDDGMVYEADVGRSFDGDPILCHLRLAAIAPQSHMVECAYRGARLEAKGESGFSISYTADFNDQDPDIDEVLPGSITMSGAGAVHDLSLWDLCFFDTRERGTTDIEIVGSGYNISVVFYSESDRQLPHELSTLTLYYIVRRMTR